MTTPSTPVTSPTTSSAPLSRLYAIWLVVAGALGLLASFVITYDKNQILINPHFVPSCSLNPVISCGTIMKSAQSAAFGFPNSWLGLIGFTAVLVMGVNLLAGARLPTWYWRLFNLGTLFGVVFVHWLIDASLYHIHALCPWCMVVWSVTLPTFWFTTLVALRQGHWPVPKPLKPTLDFLWTYKTLILVLWYLTIITLILHQFWYYFRTIL